MHCHYGLPVDVRRAQEADLQTAQALYVRILDHLATGRNYPRWFRGLYPTSEHVAAWVAQGELYLAHAPLTADDGEAGHAAPAVCGAMVLNHDTARGYEAAAWSVNTGPADVLAIHTLGVDPRWQGNGIATTLVDAAVAEARRRGCRTIRLDTVADNEPAKKLYSSYGFTDLGRYPLSYDVADITDFHLFEYVL